MQVWSLANRLLTTRQAKRLFGVIGAGGILGGSTGGFIAYNLAKSRGPEFIEFLLLAVAGGLMVCMLLVLLATLARREQAESMVATEQPKETARPGFFQSIRWIRASRYLLLITGLIIFSRVTSYSARTEATVPDRFSMTVPFH